MSKFMLLGAGGKSSAAAPAVLQVSSVAAANNDAGPQIVTFGSGITAGSTLFLGAAVGSDNGSVSNPAQVITSLSMTGVTWSRADTTQLTTTKNGSELWVGTVTTGGATSLTINHASNSHVTCAAIEVTKTLTKNGTMVESELFNDTTHEMGTKAITGSTPGIALAPCWFDPWGLASAPTFTPPSGWTTAAQRNTIGDSKRVFWFGYQLLTGAETTISPVLGLSVGDTAGQVSLLTVYKS